MQILTGHLLQRAQKKTLNIFCLFSVALFIASCEDEEAKKGPQLEEKSFTELKGWTSDSQEKTLPAFKKTCAIYQRRDPKKTIGIGGTISDWIPICNKLKEIDTTDVAQVRIFFEEHFKAYQLKEGKENKALFTGYYEPEINGSFEQTSQFNVPVYKKPSDLVIAEDLGIFNPALKGRRVAGRVKDGRLIPHDSHAQILRGSLNNQNLELLWTDNRIDHFFAQVQGSTKVRMTDGSIIRIGYAGVNGHPYVSIGKVLVQKGAFPLKQASMQSIRTWFEKNPDQIESVLGENPSFVFFRMLEKSEEDGPQGSMGVALVPRRTIAVDPKYTPLGVPVWIDFDHPTQDKRSQRLVVAHDTGGAIKGVLRADMFWGSGKKATDYAGKMKSSGTMYVLLPAHIKPSF